MWPTTLPELECALKRLTYEIYQAIQTFMEHCEPRDTKKGTILEEERFYRTRGMLERSEYVRLLAEYEAWQGQCVNHVIEATKAVNWFADVVRRDVNPLFFATKGKFFVIMGPYSMLEFRSYFCEYTEAEKEERMRHCADGWHVSVAPPE